MRHTTRTRAAHAHVPQDVVLASGCSGALDLAISALVNAGDTLLVPCPGFPLYTTLCESRGIRLAPYKLDPGKDWEVDLVDFARVLEATRDAPRRAVLLNNPSNPCGSVWSHTHTRAVMAAVEAARLPVIADEIYWHLSFPSSAEPALPAAAATTAVPVLTVGGTAKEFMVPGWRLGWVALHDRQGVLREVWKGIHALTQLVMGSNTLVQSVLPALLTPERGSAVEAALTAWKAGTLAKLEEHANYCVARLRACSISSSSTDAGAHLVVIQPRGAMYVMFRVPADGQGVRDDLLFAQQLLEQQNVFVLPGRAFFCPGFCRVVITPPMEMLALAFDRIERFVRGITVQATAQVGGASASGPS